MYVDIYADPGHAWAKIDRALLTTLGIANRISSYSYQRGTSVYLEEDCDLTMFMQAAQTAGINIEFRMHHTDRQSRIRSYALYEAG